MAMPTDPEHMTTWGLILAFFGGAGGAAKLVTHEGRIKALETRQGSHTEKIGAIKETLSTLEERSKNAIEDRKRIEEKLDRLLEKP